MLIALFLIIEGLAVGACAVLNQTKFGHHPESERLAEIERSPHYVDGELRNLTPTIQFTGGGFFSGFFS